MTPYRVTAELERLGLLTAEQEQGGRRRRVFSLTDDGRSAFRAWLSEPTSETMTIRDPSQLHLLFAELADPAAIAELARTQIHVYEARLAALDETEAQACRRRQSARSASARCASAAASTRPRCPSGRSVAEAPGLARFVGSVGRSGR